MTTYISEETGRPVEIECQFCRKSRNVHTPAEFLCGQWHGGDVDTDPVWVPVCGTHRADWFLDYDTDREIPPDSRLPILPLDLGARLMELLEAAQQVSEETGDWRAAVEDIGVVLEVLAGQLGLIESEE